MNANRALSFLAVFCATSRVVFAGTITFSFDSISLNFQGQANDLAVQTYMDSLLGGLGSITVAGAVADDAYNGDGHVVGPGNGAKSLTLAGSNGATIDGSPNTIDAVPDIFIQNIGGSSPGDDRITMTFGGFAISGLSFDYEIFPDGSSQQPPDLTFTALAANGTVVSQWTKYGVTPGTMGTYAYSPDCQSGKNAMGCGPGNTERSAQLLGTTGQLIFSSPVTKIEFIDWPATIAIDNLKIDPAPEPTSVVLLGTAAAGWLILFMRKQRRLKQST